jgi:BNR repeat-containing family member
MRRAGRMLAVFGFFLFAQVAQADWTPAKRLTWSSVDNAFPKIAVDSSGGLHVVWHSSGPYIIYYKASADGGANWTLTRRLTWNPGNSGWPAIAVDSSDNLHVVWNDDMPGNAEIYYKKSTDGGVAWTLQKRLTWTSDYSESAAIAVDSSDNLHVVWWDYTPGNCEIFYKRSSDVGVTWTPSRRLTWTSGDSRSPAIAVDSQDNLHVVWNDDTPGNNEIYYRKSTDGGSTWWVTSRRLTWTSGYSAGPAIAVDSFGNLYVLWHDDTLGKYTVYYIKSEDGGGTWTPAKRLSLTSGNSACPAIVVDSSGNLHVVWNDDMPGNAEIYYKKSTDGGTTWTADKRITWTSGYSAGPAIAVDTFGNLHVVWEDSTPGIRQIYYKKYVK